MVCGKVLVHHIQLNTSGLEENSVHLIYVKNVKLKNQKNMSGQTLVEDTKEIEKIGKGCVRVVMINMTVFNINFGKLLEEDKPLCH